MDEFPPDHHICPVQHEHVYSNRNGDMDFLIDMWENWPNIPSALPTLDTAVFDVPSSAPCIISTSSNFFSQISANSAATSNRSNTRAGLETSSNIHPLPLPSPYATNEPDLHSFSENNHIVNEHLATSMVSLMALCPPPSGMNLMSPASPPPLDLKAPGSPEFTARAGHPPLYSKARDSSQKMKPAGAIRNFRKSRARKNEEADTFLVETIQDAYLWHKYGQKNIKNRMHPRAYFKCAHPNCPVKKQAEKSSEMQGFLLINYFGKHNHSASHSQA